MKTVSVILLVLGLMVAGCTQPPAQAPPAKPPAQPPPQAAPQSCSEYCQTLPHTQCVGEWKISGTYPNCVCEFECEQASPPPPPPPPPANQTPPPSEPFATPTNKSVQEMMEDGLDRAESDFYKENDGTFEQKRYTWLRQPPPQGGIIFDQAPYQDVEFDGQSIPAIQASGFVSFENALTDTEKAYGLAIFKAKSTPLDQYTGSDAYDVFYFPDMIDKELRDCWTYARDYNINPANEWFVTYFFRCEKVVQK